MAARTTTTDHRRTLPPPELTADLEPRRVMPDDERTEAVARSLVDAGRFIPALAVDGDGRGRAEWWPLPSVGDRDMIAALVVEDTFEGHGVRRRPLETVGVARPWP